MGKSGGKPGRCDPMSKVPKFQFEDYPPAKPAKVAKLYSGETPQASPPACPGT